MAPRLPLPPRSLPSMARLWDSLSAPHFFQMLLTFEAPQMRPKLRRVRRPERGWRLVLTKRGSGRS